MSILKHLFSLKTGLDKPDCPIPKFEVRPKFSLDYEEELIKKYTKMKKEGNFKKDLRKSCHFANQSTESNILMFDTLSNMDEENVKMLMAICPNIKSKEEAKFYLEASSYDLQEAEQLFYDESIEVKRFIDVTIILPNNGQVKDRYLSSQLMWEICETIFKATNSAKEFKVVNSATGNEISIEELSSMTFDNYGFQDSCTLLLEFIE